MKSWKLVGDRGLCCCAVMEAERTQDAVEEENNRALEGISRGERKLFAEGDITARQKVSS